MAGIRAGERERGSVLIEMESLALGEDPSTQRSAQLTCLHRRYEQFELSVQSVVRGACGNVQLDLHMVIHFFSC